MPVFFAASASLARLSERSWDLRAREISDMPVKRGPDSFVKRQRERQKQQEQAAKEGKRREKSRQKQESKMIEAGSSSKLRALPLGAAVKRGPMTGETR